MRVLFLIVGALSAIGLVLGFGGQFHGAGDTIALARPLLVLSLAVVGLFWFARKPRFAGVASLIAAAFAGYSLIPPASVSDVPENANVYTVYQKNLLFRLPDVTPVAEDILKSGADFVTLQELHQRNRPILELLREAYPFQHFCPFSAVGGIAVLSRWPAEEGARLCEDYGGMSAMQVTTDDGPIWIAALHLHWPFPHRQSEHVAALLPLLRTLDGPAVVGGDFNMVSWAHSVHAVETATGTEYAGYPGPTFAFSYHHGGENLAAWLPELPIDHVLIPKGAKRVGAMRRPQFGSDHYGVLASFAW